MPDARSSRRQPSRSTSEPKPSERRRRARSRTASDACPSPFWMMIRSQHPQGRPSFPLRMLSPSLGSMAHTLASIHRTTQEGRRVSGLGLSIDLLPQKPWRSRGLTRLQQQQHQQPPPQQHHNGGRRHHERARWRGCCWGCRRWCWWPWHRGRSTQRRRRRRSRRLLGYSSGKERQQRGQGQGKGGRPSASQGQGP